MTKIDLVTGFLGSGKTTMIIEYVSYLVKQGEHVAVICNDYGAINIDRLFLVRGLPPEVPVEMVIGGDKDCTRRRLKTKLISIGMGLPDENGLVGKKFDRVIVEPSGIFDAEDFFNLVYEDPLSKWFEMGNVITMVDGSFPTDCSRAVRYMLANELAHAGSVLVNRLSDEAGSEEKMRGFLSGCLNEFGGDGEKLSLTVLPEMGNRDEVFERIRTSGRQTIDLRRIPDEELSHFASLFFFEPKVAEDELEDTVKRLLVDPACGNVFRLKGFLPCPDGSWTMINAMPGRVTIESSDIGQEVFIVIGEDLNEQVIRNYIVTSET